MSLFFFCSCSLSKCKQLHILKWTIDPTYRTTPCRRIHTIQTITPSRWKMITTLQTTPPIMPPCLNTHIQAKIIIWTGKLLRTLLNGNIFIDNKKCIFFFIEVSVDRNLSLAVISLEYTLGLVSYNAISFCSFLWILYFGSRISPSNFLIKLL